LIKWINLIIEKMRKEKKHNMLVYLFIGLTIFFTVCGQLLVKKASFEFQQFPKSWSDAFPFILSFFSNIKLIAGLLCAVIASIMWMNALSMSDISFAYPFMALSIVLVLALSPLLFKEHIPWTRWLGVAIVCIGLWIASR